MITNNQITEISYSLSNRFEAINTKYIKMIADHINSMGKLAKSDLHILEQIAKMQSNIQEINNLIIKECNITYKELVKLYKKSGIDSYEDAKVYYQAKGKEQVPFNKNINIQVFLDSFKKQTANTFVNLASTTAKSMDYTKLIDTAITDLTQGLSTPQTLETGIVSNIRSKVFKEQTNNISKNLINQTLKQCRGGLRVVYNSGYTRRLDSAVRMNILDGMRQFNMGCKEIIGKDFGADGVEIDAHGLCAEDHQDWQGKQYAFDKETAYKYGVGVFDENSKTVVGEKGRPIGEMNCQHNLDYIILGVNKPSHTNKQLKAMKDYSNKNFSFNGNEYSRYEITQLMRQMETQMRYLKDDIIVLRQFSGVQDEILNRTARLKIIQERYKEIANTAELVTRLDRARVPGF